MSRASGQVAAVGEFEALFIVQSIYTRLVRENERPNAAANPACRCGLQSWRPVGRVAELGT